MRKKAILQDVSLTIPDKTTTAIVGPSGSGKTTLCNLIARFWDVDGGSIQIGGANVRDYTLESLMDQISMVFQRVYLFADTIENNIKFGCPGAIPRGGGRRRPKRPAATNLSPPSRMAMTRSSAKAAPALSGGEKQRISIARAILKDAPIIIFDEATANVDPENEDKLQKAMEALMKDKTILMIAHRLKTVEKADQILVLDKGQIVQKGTHQELAGKTGTVCGFPERPPGSRRLEADVNKNGESKAAIVKELQLCFLSGFFENLHSPAKALLLNMEQLMIQTVLLHQLIVGSMLYQPAIVKNKDLVRIHNCTEAVSDHNNRLTFHQSGNRLLHQDFILRVEGCCGLVKQNDGSVFQQGAGNGNTLALTAGKSAAVFTEDSSDTRPAFPGQIHHNRLLWQQQSPDRPLRLDCQDGYCS